MHPIPAFQDVTTTIRSIVVTFHTPSYRYCFSDVLSDQHGECTNIHINERVLYCEETPAFTQPDFLIDRGTGKVVGLAYELPRIDKDLPRWKKLLKNLDPKSIRLSQGTYSPASKQREYSLEIIWGDANDSEKVFAQMDYGLWAFLYSTPTPNLGFDSATWTVPEGLIIADLKYIGRPVSCICSDGQEVNVRRGGPG